MKKKIIILFAILVLLTALISACDNTTPDFTDYGLSVGGKIVIDGLPEGVNNQVTILVNSKAVATTDENGLFYVSGLSKGDKVSFYKENVTFYPSEQTVSEDIYDLRVDGYYETNQNN